MSTTWSGQDWKRALTSAQSRLAKNPSVLGIGLGYKECRNNERGLRGTRCLKVLVRRKHQHPSASIAIPSSVRIPELGNLRVVTDVLSLPRCREQRLRIALGAAPSPGRPSGGVPGFLVRDGDEFGIVTAGHVLALEGTEIVPATGRVHVAPPPGAIARPDPQASYRALAKHGETLLHDIGLAWIDAAHREEVLERFATPPWSRVQRIETTRRILGKFARNETYAYMLFGTDSGTDKDVRCRLGLVAAAPFSISVEVASTGHRREALYAPMLIQSLVTSNGRFCPGDSGSPLIDADGGLIGIHVIGQGTGTCNGKGWSISAESALEFVRKQTGRPSLELVIPREVE